jgi:hypothetical protein
MSTGAVVYDGPTVSPQGGNETQSDAQAWLKCDLEHFRGRHEKYFVWFGKGIGNRPSVENGEWVVSLTDADGYRLEFASSTDAPEENELGEAE